MKNILLISSGLSPQVITESLYYHNHSKNPIKIDEVHVITDSTGSKLIKNNLFTGPGWYHQYLKDYDIEKDSIKFDMDTVYVLKDKSGKPLKDLLTVTANSSAITQIFSIVENLTDNTNNRVIANVAGGRKTMSVIIGQAIQFYGKETDLLTHVIIEEQFLRLQDFYYPPPKKTMRKIGDKSIDYSKIKIYLNELPFIRLRPALGKLIKHTHDHSLMDLVSIAQKHIDDLIKPITIVANRYHSKITVNDYSIKLSKKNMAIYMALLSLVKNNYCEDGKEIGFINIYNMIEKNFIMLYMEYYEKLHSPKSVLLLKEKERLADKKEMQRFYTINWVQETRSKINRCLREHLPPHLYAVTQIITSGKYGDKYYGIPLMKESIDISSFS